jgi:hypothetical protein
MKIQLIFSCICGHQWSVITRGWRRAYRAEAAFEAAHQLHRPEPEYYR